MSEPLNFNELEQETLDGLKWQAFTIEHFSEGVHPCILTVNALNARREQLPYLEREWVDYYTVFYRDRADQRVDPQSGIGTQTCKSTNHTIITRLGQVISGEPCDS